MIFSCMRPTYGGWSAQDVITEVEEMKHQSGIMWFQNWDRFKMDFEFISWISNHFQNGHSTLRSCF